MMVVFGEDHMERSSRKGLTCMDKEQFRFGAQVNGGTATHLPQRVSA
jgi:hypothetical protein